MHPNRVTTATQNMSAVSIAAMFVMQVMDASSRWREGLQHGSPLLAGLRTVYQNFIERYQACYQLNDTSLLSMLSHNILLSLT